MSDHEEKLQKDIDNLKHYQEQTASAFKDELALFERFFDKVNHHAKTHYHITQNNLNAVSERLSDLKIQAQNLKDSIFFHDETVIVDRQEIIADTEKSVHADNRLILDYDRLWTKDIIPTIDYLNKALIQVRIDFFDTFKKRYLESVLSNEQIFSIYDTHSHDFQEIVSRHHHEIMTLFHSLDTEIIKMDDSIRTLMERKNQLIASNEAFSQHEMKHYLDNQLMFSPIDDPTSIDIQALISDKITQFNSFKSHLDAQVSHMEQYLSQAFAELNDSIVSRLLNRMSNDMTGMIDFFDQPQSLLDQIKHRIIDAKDQGNKAELRRLLEVYTYLENYEKRIQSSQRKAHRMLARQRKIKNELLTAFKLHATNLTMDLERTLLLYQELMQHDTFLAQAIGDESSKIIKEEINFLSILAMNKELKTNINYDIDTLSIKSQINEIEMRLVHQVKKQILLQESEVLQLIHRLQLNLCDRKYDQLSQKHSIQKERLLIDRFESAMNYHLEYLTERANINRKWNSEVVSVIVNDIRSRETHNIQVAESAAKVKLVLKEYDIKALHFRTMYENELNYLVMQSQRVEQENHINNAFILTTYENQMRFAQEQLDLAESEFRLRVEAIIKAVDEERGYFDEIIQNANRKYTQRLKSIDYDYQSSLYQNAKLIQESSDHKQVKAIEHQMVGKRTHFDAEREKVLKEQAQDPTIAETKRRLRDLDQHLDDALEDADKIRQDTILEMREHYLEAKQRYEVLKPYLEQKVNLLDPTFYNGLESLNKRYQYRLKVAEIELDEASKALVDQYLEVYFTEGPQIDREHYQGVITELISLKEQAEARYAQRIQALETAYQAELSEYEAKTQTYEQERIQEKDAIKRIIELQFSQINQLLDQTDRNYLLEQANHRQKHADQIDQLTQEYEDGAKNTIRFRKMLSDDFKNVTAAYQPYIRLCRKNPDIRETFHRVNVASRKKRRKETKTILKRARKQPVIR